MKFYKIPQFVAHPNIQQLLASIWYEGVPGFRRKSSLEKLMILIKVAAMFPFYCLIYMMAPNCKFGVIMKKPFMKFLIHASSYLFFLCEYYNLTIYKEKPYKVSFLINYSNFNFGITTS